MSVQSSIKANPEVELEPPPLIPCPIILSPLHFEVDKKELVKYPVTVFSLPAAKTMRTLPFNAILQESTTSCLMLESFYNEFVANRNTEGPYYLKFPLESRGISQCVFQGALGELQDCRSAPDFKAIGTTCVPVQLGRKLFTINFFLLEHIFSSPGLEAAIVAVLGSSFSRENFIRPQLTSGGYEWNLQPPIPDPVHPLAVFTAGLASKGKGMEEVPRMMGFSARKLLYKRSPDSIAEARVAIEAFPRTPANAYHAVLFGALHSSQSDGKKHFNVKFYDAEWNPILNLFVKNHGEFGASDNWHVYG